MFLKGSLKVVWVLSNDTTQASDLTNLCKWIFHERKRIRFYWLGHQSYLKEYLGYDFACVSSNIPIYPCPFYGAIDDSLKLCENPRIGGSFIFKIKKKNQNLEVFHKRSNNPPNKSLVFKLISIDFGDNIVFFLYQSTCITNIYLESCVACGFASCF
jgi:hypothetical protein